MGQAVSSTIRCILLCDEPTEDHEQNPHETTPLYYPQAPSSHSFESTTNDINAAFLRTLSSSSSSSNSFVDSTTSHISLPPYNPPDFKNGHLIKCDSLHDQNLLDSACNSSGKRLSLSEERSTSLFQSPPLPFPLHSIRIPGLPAYSSLLCIEKNKKQNLLDSNDDSSPINDTIMAPNSASHCDSSSRGDFQEEFDYAIRFGSFSEYSSVSESESELSINQVIEEEYSSVTESDWLINPVVEEERVMIKDIRWINHYSSDQRILLVGDGDFSFSNSLAKAFGSATNIIATSLNSRGYLRKNYKKAMSNIQSLKERGGMVLHGVDATEMANHLWLKGITFDRIVFNFPLAGFFPKEPRHAEISRHRALVGGFLENAKKMISENGEIHITHKSNGFFQQWNLEALALSRGFRLVQELPFNFTDYPGYRTKYGFGGDKNFNCKPSRTYKFRLQSLSNSLYY